MMRPPRNRPNTISLPLTDVARMIGHTWLGPGVTLELRGVDGPLVLSNQTATGQPPTAASGPTWDWGNQLLAIDAKSGDLLWRFPLSDTYNKLIDSPIADMKNMGPRGAGSITAAQFIQRFVDTGIRWAHLDIAGMVWADKPGATFDKGATGYGVRLLDRFVADNFES